ncbi:MAG TPA: Hsp20/alpha crystallin family protein [Bacteriovoracaceae bacterium]|nr:Hsp20/alpha crystallin family protein [Bacteriovoracaceae bacterium]
MGIFNRNSSLTPYREQSPWSLWQKEMSDLFDRFNRDFGTFDTGEMNQFYPKIEIKEKDKHITVCAEVPGMSEKDVQVTFRDNNLILEGERKTESKQEEGGTYRSEFSYGRFYRSIPLGEEVKEDTIKASYKDGLLTIEMEKTEDQSKNVKKIPITRS